MAYVMIADTKYGMITNDVILIGSHYESDKDHNGVPNYQVVMVNNEYK